MYDIWYTYVFQLCAHGYVYVYLRMHLFIGVSASDGRLNVATHVFNNFKSNGEIVMQM